MAKRKPQSKPPQPQHPKKSKPSRHDRRERLATSNADRRPTLAARIPLLSDGVDTKAPKAHIVLTDNWSTSVESKSLYDKDPHGKLSVTPEFSNDVAKIVGKEFPTASSHGISTLVSSTRRVVACRRWSETFFSWSLPASGTATSSTGSQCKGTGR